MGDPVAEKLPLRHPAEITMFIFMVVLNFVILGVLAYQDQRSGRFWFKDRPGVTWTFVVVWLISVISGEVIFAVRYLKP